MTITFNLWHSSVNLRSHQYRMIIAEVKNIPGKKKGHVGMKSKPVAVKYSVAVKYYLETYCDVEL